MKFKNPSHCGHCLECSQQFKDSRKAFYSCYMHISKLLFQMRSVDKVPQAVAIVSADSQYLNGVFIFLNGVFNKFLLVIMSTNHLLKISTNHNIWQLNKLYLMEISDSTFPLLLYSYYFYFSIIITHL